MLRAKKLPLGPDLHQDIFDWDVRTWSRALEIWENHVEGEKRCLEVGANKGGLSLWLALNGHAVLCTDLDSPENRAKATHSKHQVGHLIHYASLDILNPGSSPCGAEGEQGDQLEHGEAERPLLSVSKGSRSLHADSYDLIIFKSILGGISRDNNLPLAKEAIDNMQAMLRPGGTILFAENLRGSAFHRLARRLFVKWGDSWNYLTVSELEELFSDFEHVEIKATGFATAFSKGKLNGLLALLDHWIFNRIFGKKVKYVGYGIAKASKPYTLMGK